MGLSMRAYARRRGCALFAVQKACRSGRIALLPDGTLDPEAADAAWDAAAAARRIAEKVPADPRRVMLPAGTLATAEATVRATLAQQGVGARAAVTLGCAARGRASASAAAGQRDRCASGRVPPSAESDGGRSDRQAPCGRLGRQHHPSHHGIRPAGGRFRRTRQVAGVAGPLPGPASAGGIEPASS
jgi:hypothetical protein